MISIDTTFLIDLYWQDSPRHKSAMELFNKLADESGDYKNEEIIVYYNCFNEFIHVITDSQHFENAMSMKEALSVAEQWRDIENVRIVYPDDSSYARALTWLSIYQLGRNRLNDTNMAACYASSGASKIITANPKDFEIFEVLETLGY